MATAKKAPAKKATAKRAPAKKATARKTTARKAAPKQAAFSVKASAEKAVNVYLGVIGKGYDAVQDNLSTARKDNEKRLKDLEKRGAKLRGELNKSFDNIDMPEFDNVVEDLKGQITKLQDQLEDAVETAKEKLTPAKAA